VVDAVVARLLLDVAPAVVGVVGPGLRVVEISGALLEELGYDADKLRGAVASDLVTERSVLDALEAGLAGTSSRLTETLNNRRWQIAVEPLNATFPGDEPGCVCVLTYDDEVDVHRALTRSEDDLEKFAAIADQSSDFIGMADASRRVVYLNQGGRDLLGLRPSDPLMGMHISEFLSPAGRESTLGMGEVVERDGRWEGETELRNFSTGEAIPVSASAFMMFRPGTSEPLAMACIMRDLRSRIKAQERVSRVATEQRLIAELGRLALTESLADVMNAAVGLVTSRYPELVSSILRQSADGATTQMIAVSDPYWEGRVLPVEPGSVSGIALAEDRTMFSADMVTDPAFTDTSDATGIRSALCVPIPGAARPWGVIGAAGPQPRDWSVEDVAFVESIAATLGAAVRRYDLEDRLQHQALHDELTGLPNRALVLDRIEHALERGARQNGLLGVLLLDLDDFKTVNDSLGHGVGDLLLSELARRLTAAVRPGDTVARLGGDEFVVLCEDLGGEDEVAFIARAVLDAFTPGVVLAGHRVSLSASVGVSLAFDGEGTTTGMLSEADIAMYRAKRDRPGTYRIFDEAMRGDVLGRLNVAGELRTAIRRGDLDVHYQPIVDLATGELQAFEALCRWTTPTGEVIPPDVFIPVAEETGLIGDLGQLVLNRAIGDATAWQSLGPIGVRVNVSAHELRSPSFFATVQGALAASPLPAERLGFEITESIFIDEDKVTQDNLTRLREAGMTILIDDFGTGYSSLSYLQRFPLVDVLKIDRSFLDEDGHGEAVVRAVVGLGHAFGFKVCAEGVENAEHHTRVTRLGCDFAQGYFLGRPMPVHEVMALLGSWHPFTA